MPTKLDKILSALAEGDKLRSEIIRDTFHNNMKAATLDYLVAGCDRIYVRNEVRNGRQVEVLSLNPASIGKVSRQAITDNLPAPTAEPTKPMRKPDNRPERFAQFLAAREREDAGIPSGQPEPLDMDSPVYNPTVNLPLVIRDHQGNFWLDDKAVKVERRSDGRWFVVGTDYLVRVENGAAPENAEAQLNPWHADRQLERVSPPPVEPPPPIAMTDQLGLSPADLAWRNRSDKLNVLTSSDSAPKPHEPHCIHWNGISGCNCARGRGGA